MVSATPEAVGDLSALAERHGVPCAEIGTVGGDHLAIASLINLSFTQTAQVWEHALPNLLD